MELNEINELIATKVMGWNKVIHESYGFMMWSDGNNKNHGQVEFFTPTDNMTSAWQVVEKFRYVEVEKEDGEYFTTIYTGTVDPDCSEGFQKIYCSTADTAPLAICLAALESIGVIVGE